MTSPPCDRCGQPVVEAHYPDGRCPRSPRRGAWKAIAVTRAIAGVILLVAATFVFLRINGTRKIVSPPVLPLPRVVVSVPACALFKRWEASAGYTGSANMRLPGNLKLLHLAVKDAHSGRVQLPKRLGSRLETGLTVLLQQVYPDGYPPVLVETIVSDEKRIEKYCSEIVQLQG